MSGTILAARAAPLALLRSWCSADTPTPGRGSGFAPPSLVLWRGAESCTEGGSPRPLPWVHLGGSRGYPTQGYRSWGGGVGSTEATRGVSPRPIAPPRLSPLGPVSPTAQGGDGVPQPSLGACCPPSCGSRPHQQPGGDETPCERRKTLFLPQKRQRARLRALQGSGSVPGTGVPPGGDTHAVTRNEAGAGRAAQSELERPQAGPDGVRTPSLLRTDTQHRSGRPQAQRRAGAAHADQQLLPRGLTTPQPTWEPPSRFSGMGECPAVQTKPAATLNQGPGRVQLPAEAFWRRRGRIQAEMLSQRAGGCAGEVSPRAVNLPRWHQGPTEPACP